MSRRHKRLLRFFSLVRMLLNSNLGLSIFFARARRNRVEYLKALGIGAAIIAGLSPALALYARILSQGYDALVPIGQSGAILTLGIVLVSAMVFFFGIFYVINTFYFAKDAEALLPLPLKGWEVLGARFTVVLFYEYLTSLFVLLPPLLIFGVKSGASVLFWVYGLLGFLLAPMVPLALASLLTMVVMRFTNFFRRKDLVRILGGILVIVLAVGLQFLFQKTGPETADPEYLRRLLTDPEGLINLISQTFPSTRYLSLALAYSSTAAGLVNLLYFAGVSLLAVALTWTIAERLYFPGIIGASETPARRRTLTRSEYEKLVRPSPPVISYLRKEIRLLLRTPTYFINCILPVFLVPVLLAVPFVLQAGSDSGLPPLETLMQNPRSPIILLAVLSGISLFLAVTDSITPTSLSREGSQFFVSKYIPVSYKKQMQAKLLSGYLFGALGSLFLILAAVLMLKLEVFLAGVILAVTLVGIIPLVEIGLLIDIIRPKLDWDNEQTAVKRNLNIIWAMIVSVLVGGGVILIVIRFMESLLTASLFMLLVYGLLGAAAYYVLMTWGVRRYQQLEG